MRGPFSEAIPYYCLDVFIKHQRRDSAGAMHAMEAMSEAISYRLALRLSDELRIPNGWALIEADHVKSVPAQDIYRYVPHAIRWIQKNSMQSAYDAYLEDPVHFLRAIREC